MFRMPTLPLLFHVLPAVLSVHDGFTSRMGDNFLCNRALGGSPGDYLLSASEELSTPCITPHAINPNALLYSDERAKHAPHLHPIHQNHPNYSHLTARYTFHR